MEMIEQDYTFAFYGDGPTAAFTRVFAFRSAEEAVSEGRLMLQAQRERGKAGATSICVGRGSEETGVAEWLGTWDWDGDQVQWLLETAFS